jgi:perosamine synthetase
MLNIKQVSPNMSQLELDNLTRSIDQKWLTEGPFCEKFLNSSLALTGAKYAVLAPNGTLGLYLALLALDLEPGSEVIVPSFTFYASAMSVYFAGLVPVFVDVDPKTYNLDIEKTKDLISSRTSAIMPVHIYGQSADMDSLVSLCKGTNIKIIEDAAQGYGVFYKGRHTGTIGDVGVISFFADKTITMGEGALILTNDEKIYEKLRLLRNQGRPNSGTFIHPSLGMNFRITDLQAAVGCAQLERLPDIIASRQLNHKLYQKKLGECENLTLHQPTAGSDYIPFRFAFTSEHKEQILNYLESNGVQTRSFFYPMHMQPKLTQYKKSDDMSVSEKLFKTGVCLPIHGGLTNEQIDAISSLVTEVSTGKLTS